MLSNCQVEEDVVGQENKIQTVSLDEAISFLKQNPLKSISKTGKKTVSYPIFDAITQEKITNSDQLITVIPLSNANKQEYSRMLLLKIKDTIKSAVFSMYLDKDTKSKDFSGKIMITTIDGEFVNAFRVKNGALVSRFVIKTKTNASFKIQNRTIIIDGVEFEELNEVIIPPRNSSNTIQYNVLYDWSAYSDNNGSGMEWNFGGGGGGSGGSSSEAEPVNEEDKLDEIADAIEDKIDDSKLDPCPKGIMEKLKNTENKDIAAVLNKLGADSIYNVDMKMGSTAQGYAQTQKISANNYLITVANDSYTSSTQLFRAATLIHEIIHAYYHSVVDDNKNPTTSPLNNFPALYQAYELKKYPGGATVAQHDQMAKDYVDSMAMALQEYYLKTQPLFFKSTSYEVFSDLAWGTLQEASVFSEKYKDGDPAKERILNRYRTESTGRSVETGTTKQQNPVGQPCY
jgi:hypothetical protein